MDHPHLVYSLEKRDNWMSDTIQNEIINDYAHVMQRIIMSEIKDNKYIGVAADGTTDCSELE